VTPAQWIAAGTALVTAAVGIASAFDPALTQVQKAAIEGAATALVPLLVGAIAYFQHTKPAA
jgi:hypothetical protein